MPTYNEWTRTNWNRAHQERDVTALTGTGLDGHLNALCIHDQFERAKNILCIGAGTGDWIHEIRKRKPSVGLCALDTSIYALNKLPDIVRLVISPRDLPRLRVFDLAMSLWVAPHISNHDLQLQLEGVIRCLLPSGLLALHYKEPIDNLQTVDNREGAPDEYRRAHSAMMLRRRNHLANMVRWAGGEVIDTVGIRPSPFYQITEAVAHITPRSER